MARHAAGTEDRLGQDSKVVLAFVRQRLPEISQGGEIGRRAGLRIAKSSVSTRCFSFQNNSVLRGENGDLSRSAAIREWRVEKYSF